MFLPKPQKISASAGRLLGCFSMSDSLLGYSLMVCSYTLLILICDKKKKVITGWGFAGPSSALTRLGIYFNIASHDIFAGYLEAS